MRSYATFNSSIMLKKERQQYLIDQISKGGRISITNMSKALGISDDTLRRDLVELENEGLLTKVHGGAIAKSEISIQFAERLHTATILKQQMAAKLVRLFKEGDVILIDGGTTNLEVAKQLPKDKCFTIYTNCLPIATELSNNPKIDLILLGGKVYAPSQVTVGISVYQTLQTISPDWVIIGVSDIHPKKGLTDSDREEAMIKRCMLERGKMRVVLADSHKLDTARHYHVASLSEIDYIVTEDDKVEYIKQHWSSNHSFKVI